MNAKEAVKVATDYFRELFSDQPIINIRLEEVERTEDGRFWKVTLGFDRGDEGDIRNLLGQAPRYYKLITINARTGEAESVKMRTV